MAGLTIIPNIPLARPRPVTVKEHKGEEVVTYTRDAEGKVTSSANSQDRWVARTKRKLWESVVPENLSANVSKDYVKTRKWQVARDAFGAFGGTASLTACVAAIGAANSALLGLGIAGVTLANVTWVKDRLTQLTNFTSTGIARVAEKNPRPWILAADIVTNTGTVIDATTAILPPVAYYPLITAMAVIRSAIGTAEGAAGAGIAPRQAIADNIGEVGVKNSNQSTIATTLGATASLVALGALTSVIGFGPAAITVAAVGSVGGLFCKYQMLQNLDYNPVNEGAVRRVINSQEKNGTVPGPAKNLLGQLPTVFRRSKLVIGERVAPLLDDPNFPKLREAYQNRAYILCRMELRTSCSRMTWRPRRTIPSPPRRLCPIARSTPRRWSRCRQPSRRFTLRPCSRANGTRPWLRRTSRRPTCGSPRRA